MTSKELLEKFSFGFNCSYSSIMCVFLMSYYFTGAISSILQEIQDVCNVKRSHQSDISILESGNVNREFTITVISRKFRFNIYIFTVSSSF